MNENKNTNKAATETLTAETIDDTIVVRASEGGVWWPSEDATDEIEASDNPEAAAVAMCDASPMRGTWKQ